MPMTWSFPKHISHRHLVGRHMSLVYSRFHPTIKVVINIQNCILLIYHDVTLSLAWHMCAELHRHYAIHEQVTDIQSIVIDCKWFTGKVQKWCNYFLKPHCWGVVTDLLFSIFPCCPKAKSPSLTHAETESGNAVDCNHALWAQRGDESDGRR